MPELGNDNLLTRVSRLEVMLDKNIHKWAF